MPSKSVVLLASSRSSGNTRALVDFAFPRSSAPIEDVSTLRIGYFSYSHANDQDDFYPLVRRLLEYGIWVLATPLYWYTVSAQAKTFIDRLSDLLTLHKEEGRLLRGKSLAVLCTGTDPDLPAGFDAPLQLTAKYLGMRFLGTHYAQFDGDKLVHPDAPSKAVDFIRAIQASSDG